MSRLTPKVFVDFDGTITRVDVGNAFFRKFGDEEASLKLVEEWKKGRLSGKDLLHKEAETVSVSYQAAAGFVDSIVIDGTFPAFLQYCREKSLDMMVLSDGLDFYIKRILDRNGMPDVPFRSNVARFESSRLRVETPYESDCTWCANCKGYQILTSTGIDEAIVYVGNGFSDRCAVKYADVVFAKDDLLRYCEENNITYFPFDTFEDVQKKFSKIMDAGGPRKRHRAELLRREAYLAE